MVQGCNRGTVSNFSKRCSVMRVNCVVGHGFYFMGGMPRSLQIFFAKKSLISLCLGIADLLFKLGYATTSAARPLVKSSQPCERR